MVEWQGMNFPLATLTPPTSNGRYIRCWRQWGRGWGGAHIAARTMCSTVFPYYQTAAYWNIKPVNVTFCIFFIGSYLSSIDSACCWEPMHSSNQPTPLMTMTIVCGDWLGLVQVEVGLFWQVVLSRPLTHRPACWCRALWRGWTAAPRCGWLLTYWRD